MNFKLWTIFLLATSMLLGCQKVFDSYLVGKPKQEDLIEINTRRLECIREIPNDLKLYFAADLQVESWTKSMDCLDGALEHFAKFTRGENPNSYTTKELRNFFTQYLFKKNQVSDGLAKVLMKLKETLVGGNAEHLSRQDIAKMREITQVLKGSLAELRPHLKVLMLEKDLATQSEIDEAIQKIDKFLLAVWPLEQREKVSITLADIQVFLSELNLFIDSSANALSTKSWDQWVPVIQSFRNLIMGPIASLETSKEWEAVQKDSLEIYRLFLVFRLQLSKTSPLDPQEAAGWSQFGTSTLDILKKTLLQYNTSKRFTFTGLDTILDQLDELGLLKLPVSKRTFKDIYKKSVTIFLDPRTGGEKSAIQGVEEIHLMVLTREFYVWAMVQKFLSTLDEQSLSWQDLQKRIKAYSVEQAVARWTELNSYDRAEVERSWGEFWMMIEKSPHLVWQKGQIRLQSQIPMYDREGLTRANLFRSVTRLVHWGYGGKSDNPMRSIVGLDALRGAYKDIEILGGELGVIDPRNPDPAKRAMMEANLFAFSSDGNDQLFMPETFEWLQMIVSGGIGTSTRWLKELARHKCLLERIDIFGKNWINEECFVEAFAKEGGTWLPELPDFTSRFKAWSLANRRIMARNLIVAGRNTDPSQKAIDTGDLRTMVMILFYTESLVLHFDQDRNGTLSAKEVEAAVPRFSKTLLELSPIKKEYLLKDILSYLVFIGEKPSASGFAQFMIKSRFSKPDEAERYNLVRVFGVLRAEMVKTMK